MIGLDKYKKELDKKERNRKKIYKKIMEEILTNIGIYIRENVDYYEHIFPLHKNREDEYDLEEALIYVSTNIQKDVEFKKIMVEIEYDKPNKLTFYWDINKYLQET